MKIAEANLRTIDWALVEEKRKAEKLTREELSELVGKGKSYITNSVSRNSRVHKDVAKALAEILDLKEAEKPAEEQPAEENPNGKMLDYLIAEIGMLKGEIEALKKKMEKPQIVAIPMHPREMAIRTLEQLLEGGWCTKDAVLSAFNEKHIPLDYLSDAVRANGAIGATSGVADHARTFYIKEESI